MAVKLGDKIIEEATPKVVDKVWDKVKDKIVVKEGGQQQSSAAGYK